MVKCNQQNKSKQEITEKKLTGFKLLRTILYLDTIRDAELQGILHCETDADIKDSISKIASKLQKYILDSKK
ncbi:MAG: hypothetical protein ACYCZ1_00830 [Candidatus Humimicrobiaceae bacterium]